MFSSQPLSVHRHGHVSLYDSNACSPQPTAFLFFFFYLDSSAPHHRRVFFPEHSKPAGPYTPNKHSSKLHWPSRVWRRTSIDVFRRGGPAQAERYSPSTEAARISNYLERERCIEENSCCVCLSAYRRGHLWTFVGLSLSASGGGPTSADRRRRENRNEKKSSRPAD